MKHTFTKCLGLGSGVPIPSVSLARAGGADAVAVVDDAEAVRLLQGADVGLSRRFNTLRLRGGRVLSTEIQSARIARQGTLRLNSNNRISSNNSYREL